MQRVNRKYCGDKCASPKSGRDLLKQQKKKDRARAVQQNINEVMRTRFQAEDLAIEHVRDRRQWMPVMRMNVSERPLNVGPAQPGLNLTVLADVGRIIVIHESVSQRLPKNGPRDHE